MLQQENLQPPATVDDTHVQSSLEMIAEAAELAEPGSAAVLGCGRCAEIPVRILNDRFDRVDYVDLDADAQRAVEAKLNQEGGKAGGSYTAHCADLTGLIAQVEPAAQQLAQKASMPLPCLDSLGQLLTSATPGFWRPSGGETYNLIVCSSILTQLQATVRKRVEGIFLNRFPEHRAALSTSDQWRRHAWMFARRLEDAFIGHLAALSAPGAIVYLSDTVHVCWLLQRGRRNFTTTGAWLATRTSRLADYLHPGDEIITERQWRWFRKQPEGAFWGRLYGVQAIIFRPAQHGRDIDGWPKSARLNVWTAGHLQWRAAPERKRLAHKSRKLSMEN